MKLKNVVKVMNFHSLLRVDKSRRKAESYRDVGEEITHIISRIIYNKNLVLDKQVLLSDPTKPKLNIYIANDYGFCGNFNSQIRKQIRKDEGDVKIIIGKKIPNIYDDVLLRIEKDNFYKEFDKIETAVDKAINEAMYSEINLYYNHYYSSTVFNFIKVQLFPIEFPGKYFEGEDFVHETDVNKMLRSLLTFYICYELRMCECNSSAAENIVRSQITNLALDKLEEIEEVKKNKEIKDKKEKAMIKSVENYKKIIAAGGDDNG